MQAHPEYTKDNEGYHIAQIFIVPKGEQKDVEVRLKVIYDALNSGMPFPEVAKKYSDDQASANGGDLGFVKKDYLSKEFLEVIGKLREGEISPPFGSDLGIHIIQLREVRLFKSETEFRELVRQKVVEDRFARAYKNWRRGLRDRAYVEIMLN
jgi:peptidyl-prolyl cis-trans isomerase SurA